MADVRVAGVESLVCLAGNLKLKSTTFRNLKAGGTLQLEQEQKKLPLTSVRRENTQPEQSGIREVPSLNSDHYSHCIS